LIKLILIFILFACSISAQIRVELPSDSVLLKNYLQVAEEQVGVREATGKNDGTRIDDYLQSAGYKRGSRYPYCISGIYYCFDIAAKRLNYAKSKIPIIRTGSSLLLFNDALKRGKRLNKYYASKYDIIVWINANKTGGHGEIVTNVGRAGWVTTIGFNTTSGLAGAQNEGEGVYKRQRNVLHFLGRMQVRGLIHFKKN